MIDIPNILEFLEFFDFLRGPLAGYLLSEIGDGLYLRS